MTDLVLNLIGSALFGATLGWIHGAVVFKRPRREQKPEPMEYQEPRVFTRIWDGNINTTKEN